MSPNRDLTSTETVVAPAQPSDQCPQEQINAFLRRAADAIRHAPEAGLESQIPAARCAELRHEVVTTFGRSQRARQALVRAGLILFDRGLIGCANQFFDLALVGIDGEARDNADKALKAYIEKSRAAAATMGPALTPPPNKGAGFRK